MPYIADRMISDKRILSPALWRAISGAIIAIALTSCFATTDRLAVYEKTVLSQEQVAELAGYYGWVGEQRSIASISFAPRTDRWPYRPPGQASSKVQLASANFAFKSLTVFEDGDAAVRVLDGVAIFSAIPGTELILASIPGETLRLSDETGNMTTASEQNTATNLFFVLKRDGSELRNQFYADDDEALRTAVGDPSKPLPVGKLLDYLQEHAEERFFAADLPAYSMSTPQQKRLFEQEINAALSEDREKAIRGAAPGAQPAKEPAP